MRYSVTAWMWMTLLAVGLVATPAMADESRYLLSPMYMKSTLVVSMGRSTEQNGCTSPWMGAFSTTPRCSEKDRSYGISYEYHITQMWGVQGSFGQSGYSSANGTASFSGNGAQWSMRARTYALYGTCTLPLANNFSLKGKVGVARTSFLESMQTTLNGAQYIGVSLNGVGTLNNSKNSIAYGLGAQYDITRDVGVVLQYDNYGSYDEYSLYHLGNTQKIKLSGISLGLAMTW